MKTKRFSLLSLAVLIVLIVSHVTAKADLNAQAIVNQFNSATGGNYMHFGHTFSAGAIAERLSGFGFADTSAYQQGVTAGSDYFLTFCVEPSEYTEPHMSAKLNYANGMSQTTTGKTLTLGAAYLYKMFATGTLSGYDYTGTYQSRYDSYNTMWLALGTLMDNFQNAWSGNQFLSQLLGVNSSESYWTQAYDPGKYYDIIGDYSVFVMNCYGPEELKDRQDFLYIAKASSSSSTPEPATVLLWGLGMLGAFGAVRSKGKYV